MGWHAVSGDGMPDDQVFGAGQRKLFVFTEGFNGSS
jgi:hypothetical protein